VVERYKIVLNDISPPIQAFPAFPANVLFGIHSGGSSLSERRPRAREIAGHLSHGWAALFVEASRSRFCSKADVSDEQRIDSWRRRNVEPNLVASSAV
jgi:hypothetical protein